MYHVFSRDLGLRNEAETHQRSDTGGCDNWIVTVRSLDEAKGKVEELALKHPGTMFGWADAKTVRDLAAKDGSVLW